MPGMHRLIVLIIMLVVPLQSAWSTAMALHAHLTETVPAMASHEHASHTHDDHSHAFELADASDPASDEDGHHDHHSHPVFNPVLLGHIQPPMAAHENEPILQAPVSFFSHTPPLFDRPPLARA